jgi:signal transduction histidine kinase
LSLPATTPASVGHFNSPQTKHLPRQSAATIILPSAVADSILIDAQNSSELSRYTVAAHELRNPMTPMIGLVELLLRR